MSEFENRYGEKTIGGLIAKGTRILTDAGIENSQGEARHLLALYLEMDMAAMYARLDEEVNEFTSMRYMKAIKKRATHYPYQYLIGFTYFLDYTFICEEGVLIPRYDTENLVLKALEMSPDKDIDVLDMCTGSGCVGISYYLMREKIGYDDNVTLADISEDALELSKKNARKFGAHIDIIKTDLFEELKDEKGRPIKKYDMILSNPPYIRTKEINNLIKDVRDFEPRSALDGSSDGLRFYRAIVEEATRFLKEDGKLVMEIGYDQYMDVEKLMREAGFFDIYKMKDMSGYDRVIYGTI